MVHPEAALLPSRFPSAVYAERREAVRKRLSGGLAVFPAAPVSLRNPDNAHPFRQDSHLLWLAPVHRPGLALVLDADSGEDVLFGPPEDPDDLVWHGPHPALAEEAEAVGLRDVRDLSDLPAFLRERRQRGQALHLLPPHQPSAWLALAAWLGASPEGVEEHVSEALVHALGDLRLRKSPEEVAQIEAALAATDRMFRAALRAARPGTTEAAVYAEMARTAFAEGMAFSFQPIVTVRGEVLHNETYANALREGDLLLVDAGLETSAGYASDVTRTAPVSGRFTPEQLGVYEVVLAAHQAAIGGMRPGANWRDLHDLAAQTVAGGLRDLGLMRGDPEEAVAEGAHALFFPHGLGHPLGLDVHDFHDLGDAVAYPPDRPRSEAFGTRFLRFGRDLEEGMVMTVEPGVYFIPALLDRWRQEGRHAAFIDYERAEAFRDLGGVRIEDDVLVEASGARVLGPEIPRSPEAVEAAVRGGAQGARD
jgi:Xaa-Pro aminopeptidase